MRYIFIVSLFLLSLQLLAQENNKVNYGTQFVVYGPLEDDVTGKLPGQVKYEMLSKDSLLLFTGVCNPNQAINGVQGIFIIPLPDEGSEYHSDKYLFRFSLDGYRTVTIDYKPGKLYKNEPAILHKPIRMHRLPKNQTLGEAVVTATKVKFYAKGDTLVYNADAFLLAEGSMLDALIKQLPGVEFHSDGRIYVNGRYVESLLLNGEDFFKRDRTIMLENLPSYMVKTVQVYDKQGRMGEMLGQKVGDEQLVMDVRLKKQYSTGWIANAEGAYGTEERYLAKLFGLRFTNNSRLALFGSINNVNETRKPGEDSNWTPQQSGTGLTTIRYAGADYLINDKDKRFKIDGSVDVRHTDDKYDTQTTRTNFLTMGDTYGSASYKSRNHSFSMSTNHSLALNWTRIKVRTQPSFSYSRSRNTSNSISSTSSEKLTNLLDSIFSPYVSSDLLHYVLNRVSSVSSNAGHNFSFTLPVQASFNLPHSINSFYLEGAVTTSHHKSTSMAQRYYDYPASGNASEPDFRHEYQEMPYRNNSEWIKVSYIHFLKNNWRFTPYYKYHHTYSNNDNMLYRLDWVDENLSWNEMPSIEQWQQTALDGQNSTRQRSHSNYNVVGVSLNKEEFRNNYWRFDFDFPLSIDHDRINYTRPTVLDTTFSRQNVFFRPSLSVSNSWYKKEGDRVVGVKRFGLAYAINASAFPMQYLITLPNNSDPLSVQLGNKELQNSWQHQLSANFSNSNTEKQRTWSVSAAYKQTMRAVVMGYVYDISTGKRTFKPSNVNGNYNLQGLFSLSMPLDKQKRWLLSSSTQTTYNHNVDLISTSQIETSQRSVVHNVRATETLKIAYSLSKFSAAFTSKTTLSHSYSHRENFQILNAFDLSNGITLQWEMPANFQLSTDFTLYSRRGYNDKYMNTDDFVWNMRIAKRLFKGKLTLMCDGFDLLHQISNVRRSVNGQGLVETRYLAIPRYVMLHVVYKLSKKPKSTL